MSLVEVCPPERALQQGDILKDLALYGTTIDAKPTDLSRGTGMALVLSRNCKAVNSDCILVSLLEEKNVDVFSSLASMSLEDTRRILASVRDGDGRPDRFYLGALPGRTRARAFACLDKLFTIAVPTGDKARSEWVAAHRVATLDADHRRDLHCRILSAFAREGYNDFTWWPSVDLQIMILAGRREIRAIEEKIATQTLLLHQLGAPAGDREKSQRSAIETDLKSQHTKKADAEKVLQPYLDVWSTRHLGVDPITWTPD